MNIFCLFFCKATKVLMQPDIPLVDTTQQRNSEKQVAVIMNTTISKLVGEVYLKLSKVKSLYNEQVSTGCVWGEGGGGVSVLQSAQWMCLLFYVFIFKKETLCSLALVLILSSSARGSSSPYSPTAEREETWAVFTLISPLHQREVTGRDVGPTLSPLLSHASAALCSDWTAGGVGHLGSKTSVAYCAVVLGHWGLPRRDGFSCRSRPPPAGRPSLPPATGNTPQRSWRGTGSGAAVSRRCAGSVPRRGKSVDKHPEMDLYGATPYNIRNDPPLKKIKNKNNRKID